MSLNWLVFLHLFNINTVVGIVERAGLSVHQFADDTQRSRHR